MGKKIHTHINIFVHTRFAFQQTHKRRGIQKVKSHYINNKHYLSIYLAAAVPVVDWNIGAFGTPEAFFKSWFDCCEVCP